MYMTREEIIAFETDVAETFNAAKIRSMIHLHDDDGIDRIVKYFENVHPNDWVLCSWRSHVQCLLKGVPPEQVKAAIVAGKSIALCFPEYKVLSSGIVGGMLPIAVGLAAGIKRQNGADRVHVFIGDMTSETGIAHECIKYSQNHDLPVHFVIEDNNRSVCTDTRKVWNQPYLTFESAAPKVTHFKYEMKKYPHTGAGVRVEF